MVLEIVINPVANISDLLLRLYDSKLLDGGENFTWIIKSDLTDVTQ